MAEWLEQASQWHEMYCLDLEVMCSNSSQIELGVHNTSVLSTSVQSCTLTKNIIDWIILFCNRRKTRSEIEEDRLWNGTEYKSYPGPEKEGYPAYPPPKEPEAPENEDKPAQPCKCEICGLKYGALTKPDWSRGLITLSWWRSEMKQFTREAN